MSKHPKVAQKARELQSALDEAGIGLEIYIGTKPGAVEAMKAEALMRLAGAFEVIAAAAQRIADQGEQYEEGDAPWHLGQSLSDVPL